MNGSLARMLGGLTHHELLQLRGVLDQMLGGTETISASQAPKIAPKINPPKIAPKITPKIAPKINPPKIAPKISLSALPRTGGGVQLPIL